MDAKTLQRANTINNDIYNATRTAEDIKAILDSYDSWGSSIEFTNNRSSQSRSYGSKKFGFKPQLKTILEYMRLQCEEEVRTLTDEFNKL